MLRSERFETSGKVRLEVDNAAGSVGVSTAAGGDGVVQVELSCDDEKLVEEAKVDCRPEPGGSGGTVVRVRIPRRRHVRWKEVVQVSVVVPEGADLNITTASAEVSAVGRYDGVEIETASGGASVDFATDLRLRSASGRLSSEEAGTVTARSASGTIVVRRATGAASLATASGSLRVGHVLAAARLETVSGNLEVDIAEEGVSAKTVSGEIRVKCVARGEVSLDSVSGGAVVGIPAGRSVEVDARSLSGRLRSDIPLDEAPDAGAGGGGGAEAGRAGGHVRVRSGSVSGDLQIVRADLPPASAAPNAGAGGGGGDGEDGSG